MEDESPAKVAELQHPRQQLTTTLDYKINNDLLNAYNSMGFLDETTGVYTKEPFCNICLRDLLRFLRADSQVTFDARRQLGAINIVQNDLIPLIKQHCLLPSSDTHGTKTGQHKGVIELFDLVLRLLMSLTSPAILLFKEQLPEEKEAQKIYMDLVAFLFAYKTALCRDVRFWSVIASHMGRILKLDFHNRQEEDKVMFERILILVRNVLHVPSEDANDVAYGENNVHDLLLISLKSARLFDLLLYVCKTQEEHEFCFHVLEVLSLMLKEQLPDKLAANQSLSASDRKDQIHEDVNYLKQLKEREAKQPASSIYHTDRFRGAGTYTVKNFKVMGDNDLICHRQISDVNEIKFDSGKKQIRKAKNRQHMRDRDHISTGQRERFHCSSPEVKRYLKELCREFLQDSYNLFMSTVRRYLDHASVQQQNDDTYYLWAAQFFMEFNRAANEDCNRISATFAPEYLHYLHCLIDLHLDRIETEKKKFAAWSKRLHYALKAYKELIFTVAYVQSGHKIATMDIADEIKEKLFYEQEYRELLRKLLIVYDPIKMSDGYLDDLIEANHMFMKMFEYYAKKKGTLVVARKKRKIRARKKKTDVEQQAAEQPELVWAEIEEDVANALDTVSKQSNLTDDADLDLFDPLSSTPRDDQKLKVMKRINLLLRARKGRQAVSVYKTARYFFYDDGDNAFGQADAPKEDNLASLKEILMNEFLVEAAKEDDKASADEMAEDDDADPQPQFTTTEENLEFSDFVRTYAVPKVLMAYCCSLQRYEQNSAKLNNCIIRLFHRIAHDCQMYVMFFQLSILRILQQVMNKYSANKFYAEFVRFGCFIVSKLLMVAQKNDKVYIEMLYWKYSRDAYEIEEGYGTMAEKQKKNKSISKKRKGAATEGDALPENKPKRQRKRKAKDAFDEAFEQLLRDADADSESDADADADESINSRQVPSSPTGDDEPVRNRPQSGSSNSSEMLPMPDEKQSNDDDSGSPNEM